MVSSAHAVCATERITSAKNIIPIMIFLLIPRWNTRALQSARQEENGPVSTHDVFNVGIYGEENEPLT
jgi:hypothetical protein